RARTSSAFPLRMASKSMLQYVAGRGERAYRILRILRDEGQIRQALDGAEFGPELTHDFVEDLLTAASELSSDGGAPPHGQGIRGERGTRTEENLRFTRPQKLAAERDRLDPIQVFAFQSGLFGQFAADIRREQSVEFACSRPQRFTGRRAMESARKYVLPRSTPRQIWTVGGIENDDGGANCI